MKKEKETSNYIKVKFELTNWFNRVYVSERAAAQKGRKKRDEDEKKEGQRSPEDDTSFHRLTIPALDFSYFGDRREEATQMDFLLFDPTTDESDR